MEVGKELLGCRLMRNIKKGNLLVLFKFSGEFNILVPAIAEYSEHSQRAYLMTGFIFSWSATVLNSWRHYLSERLDEKNKIASV